MRYNVRLAQKKGVVIKEGKREDLKDFHKIMVETGERDGFIIRPLSYFEKIYDEMAPEHMKLLMLNSKAKLLGETNISKGTVNASLITPRELFIEALQKNAVSIIILHNHPSGDPTPSREDMLTTKRILDAGALIGIDLLDHIIIGNNCYMSFREEGML